MRTAFNNERINSVLLNMLLIQLARTPLDNGNPLGQPLEILNVIKSFKKKSHTVYLFILFLVYQTKQRGRALNQDLFIFKLTVAKGRLFLSINPSSSLPSLELLATYLCGVENLTPGTQLKSSPLTPYLPKQQQSSFSL